MVLKKSAFVKFLEDCRTRFERRQRVFDPFFPFGVRQIAAERDPATAPPERRNSAHFYEKVAIFLAELRSLAPVVDLQSWNDCVLGQGSWIEQPGVGNHFL